MDIKTGTETKQSSEKTGGVFEFGAASEAEKDSTKVETPETSENTENKDTASSNSTDSNATSENQEGTEEHVEGEEQVVTEKPFEVDGRTFTTRDELITAYKNSSAEGIRLDRLTKNYQHEVSELTKKLLELEEKQGALPFPGLLSLDPEQEAAQLEMLPNHKQTEYILNKKDWEKQQTVLKEQREQRKAQLVTSDTGVKEAIETSEKEMTSQTDKYPGFEKLKPTMAKIIELTPSIANRPETPYLSFWIAYGLDAFSKAKAINTKTNETIKAVQDGAKLAHTQIGKSGTGKPVSATTSNSGIVNSYRERNKVDL